MSRVIQKFINSVVTVSPGPAYAGKIVNLSADGRFDKSVISTPFADLYNNATQYKTSELRIYTSQGTTNSNGEIIFIPTDTGLIDGTALFSSILSVQLTGVRNTTTAIQAPMFYLRDISVDRKQVTVRGVSGVTINLLVTPTMTFLGSGITCNITILGTI